MSGRNRFRSWFALDFCERLPTETGLVDTGLWNLGKCNGCGRDLGELVRWVLSGFSVITTIGELDSDLCDYCFADRVGTTNPCVRCGTPHQANYEMTAFCEECTEELFPWKGPRLLSMRAVSKGASTLPLAREISFTNLQMVVSLDDGRYLGIPLEWFPRLLRANVEQRENWHLSDDGGSVRWPDIDEDVCVDALVFGWKRPMEKEEILKVGDVVKLRSGGPGMTIVAIEKFDGAPGDGIMVKCSWFPDPYATNGVGGEEFPLAALEKVR